MVDDAVGSDAFETSIDGVAPAGPASFQATQTFLQRCHYGLRDPFSGMSPHPFEEFVGSVAFHGERHGRKT